MTASTLRVRRATVEDLGILRPLWESMRLPVAELEPRLTEFQVVENAEGRIVGGIGLEVAGRQARLHSEAFTDFALADAGRELVWARVQTLASNHGILRIWTQESVPFWNQTGFKPAGVEDLKKLPPAWNAEDAAWLTLQLKNEEVIASLEKELAMFMAAEKRDSDRVFQQARFFKTIATVLAIIFAILVFAGGIYLLRNNLLPHH